MANGKRKRDSPEDIGYLSDESDFYGDKATKQEFENRASTFDAAKWWRHKIHTLNEIAEINIASATETKNGVLYNPYAGQKSGRQLDETIDEFLHRLPPCTTPLSYEIPWIYVANPYRKAPSFEEHSDIGAGPPDEDSDWAQFMMLGGNLLEELTGLTTDIEEKKKGQTKATITKAINIEKDKIVRKILDTAKELHCTSGKWMLFCPSADVNAVWSVIARNTAENELGIAAKVAPNEGDTRKDRPICVYTKDFNNIEDVTRVLKKLKALGLYETKGKPLYYKCDAYTHLQLNSKNDWGIKASLYNSTEILNPSKKQNDGKTKKLDSYFYKKKDPGDWRSLERE